MSIKENLTIGGEPDIKKIDVMKKEKEEVININPIVLFFEKNDKSISMKYHNEKAMKKIQINIFIP